MQRIFSRLAFFLLLFLVLDAACTKPSRRTSTSPASTDTTATQQASVVVVHDTTLYDEAFVAGLSWQQEPIELLDNNIISGSDTFHFPADPKMNRTYRFHGKAGNDRYDLTVIRTRFTTLEYSLKNTNSKNFSVTKNGRATLDPLFFRDSSAAAFKDKSGECAIAILVLPGKNRKNKKEAVLGYGCDSKLEVHLKE